MPLRMLSQVETLRTDPTQVRLTTAAIPDLAPGEVLAEVDRFALTANNVSYAVTGESLGYWKAYPCPPPWGVIPVWGFATVVESRAEGFAPGERFWGLLPMSSHVRLVPGEVSDSAFTDMAPHREGLAPVYNRLLRTQADSPALAGREMERCALLPVFTTAFIIDDFLADNDWFGGRQVIILSASSKTGIALADLLARREGRPVGVVGVTSAANRTYVGQFGDCDEIIAYGDIEGLDPETPTVVVDLAGSADVLARTHRHFAENLTHSCIVGATHWRDGGARKDLPGARPKFFFAPAQIAKRDLDWGPGEVRRRAQVEGLRIADRTAHQRVVQAVTGPELWVEALRDLVAGRVPPDRVLMLSAVTP